MLLRGQRLSSEPRKHYQYGQHNGLTTFLIDLGKNLFDEKVIYEQENQIDAFKSKIKPILGRSFNEKELEDVLKTKNEEFENIIKKKFDEFRDKRNSILTIEANLELEKRIFLQTIDFLWRSHLQYLEHLRQVVGLRGYAQKDPLEEFKREAFKLFEGLLNKIKIDFITFLNNLEVVPHEERAAEKTNKHSLKNTTDCLLTIRKNEKIQRNEKCPATGKKFKHCCGAL